MLDRVSGADGYVGGPMLHRTMGPVCDNVLIYGRFKGAKRKQKWMWAGAFLKALIEFGTSPTPLNGPVVPAAGCGKKGEDS